MHIMEAQLPGGLVRDGVIHRNVRFHVLTGLMAQSLIESATGHNRPGYVSNLLGQVLDRIGDLKADARLAAELWVADRQYLMLRLAALLDGEQMWLKVVCAHSESFQTSIEPVVGRTARQKA